MILSSGPLSFSLLFLMGMHHRTVLVSIPPYSMFSTSEMILTVCLSNTDRNTSPHSRPVDTRELCNTMCAILYFCGNCGSYSLHNFEDCMLYQLEILPGLVVICCHRWYVVRLGASIVQTLLCLILQFLYLVGLG